MRLLWFIILLFAFGLRSGLACSTHHEVSQAGVNTLATCVVIDELILETNVSMSDPIIYLDSLKNLVEITGNLIIRNNPSLIDISGLARLTTVRGDVIIENNPQLSQCCVLDGLINLGFVGGAVMMESNASLGNCNQDGNALGPCNPIPTTGEWGIIILMLIFMITGVSYIRFPKKKKLTYW